MDPWVALLISFLVTCGVVGMLGNGIILRVFQKRRHKVSTDILVITLAAVDFISSVVFFAPITWAISSGFRTRFNCAFFWYFRRTFGIESALLTGVTAIDRYVMVCSPCKLKTSKKKGIVSAVLSTMFCFFICLQWAAYGSAVKVGESTVCSYTGPGWILSAFGVIINCIYLMNCISCSFCYFMIYRKIKRHNEETSYMQSGISAGTVSSRIAGHSDLSRNDGEKLNVNPEIQQECGHSEGVSEPAKNDAVSRLHIATHQSITSTVSPAVDKTESSNAHSNKSLVNVKNKVSPAAEVANVAMPGRVLTKKPRKQKDKMTKMMLIVTLFYLFSSLPVVVFLNTPVRYVTSLQQSAFGERMVDFFYQMRLINHIINFFVYYGVNEHFRRETHELFGIKAVGG